MGEVVEVGSAVTKFKLGDRAVLPFTISCGECFFCQKSMYSLCDRTNPNAQMARKAKGQSPAGLFGYSHMLGGFPGAQAEYLRVPFADVGPIKFHLDWRMNRYCSFRTFFRPDIWPPKTAKFNKAIPLRSGDAVQ